MASSTVGATLPGAVTQIPFPQTTSSTSTNSFAQQLAAAIAGYLSQSADSSHLEVDIDAEPGQDPGARQFVVTVKDSHHHSPAALSAASLTAPAPTPPNGRFLMDLITPTQPGVKPPPSSAPLVTPTDAYWSLQPPAVQTLRDMPDDDKRLSLAKQLAQQGYTIDVPIMVWGWDPLVTMTVRRNMGYTWVPSGLQSPVPVVPGVDFPGLPSYDPKSPPAGSIQVSTAFAKLANTADPWMPGDFGANAT